MEAANRSVNRSASGHPVLIVWVVVRQAIGTSTAISVGMAISTAISTAISAGTAISTAISTTISVSTRTAISVGTAISTSTGARGPGLGFGDPGLGRGPAGPHGHL